MNLPEDTTTPQLTNSICGSLRLIEKNSVISQVSNLNLE